MLQPGNPAPDFTLPDGDGVAVPLAGFRGQKTVVLYFYPKDDTPGCTVEGREFTALEEAFEAAGAVVLGVSRDDAQSHRAFCAKYGLTVRLLSDLDGKVCEAYGVWQEKEKEGKRYHGIVRSTFVIDRDGVLREALYGVTAQGHAEAMLEVVRALA